MSLFRTSEGRIVCRACRLEQEDATPLDEAGSGEEACDRCGRSGVEETLWAAALGTVTADEMVDILFRFGDDFL